MTIGDAITALLLIAIVAFAFWVNWDTYRDKHGR